MDKQSVSEIATQLNQIYEPLEMKAAQLAFGLHHRIFDPQVRYYSGHYHRGTDGKNQREYFPIPVVEVPGYCDVEVNLDCVTVSTKLRRDAALVCTFDKFQQYEFEAFGVDDYLLDFYLPGMTIEKMKENIRSSDEKEIGFSFQFTHEIDGDTMYEFVKLLRRQGFYY